jgi:hypothetical protein
VAGHAGAGSAVNDTISEVGGAFGVAIVGSLARAQCQLKSHRGPGQACTERDSSGQPGI